MVLMGCQPKISHFSFANNEGKNLWVKTTKGMSRALASELAHYNIRVNTILPGYIETDMTKGKRFCNLLIRLALTIFATNSYDGISPC